MSFRSSIAGTTTGPIEVECDRRWLMAFAAGLELVDARHFDTSRPGGVRVHPLFPVAPEWALITSTSGRRDDGLSAVERARGVHAGHDLVVHRPICQDDHVSLRGTIVGVEKTSAGCRTTERFDAIDLRGVPVWTTWMVTVYRGVDVDGPDVVPNDRPAHVDRLHQTSSESVVRRSIPLAANAAHVYTECARIWNPIHTDLAFARAAGLPSIILHGTATLALAVSATAEALDKPYEAVSHLGGRFRAMVPLPTTLTIEIHAPLQDEAHSVGRFRVLTPDGAPAVADGYVVAGPVAAGPADHLASHR